MESEQTRCLIDASALIGLIDEDDLFAEKAMAVFEHIKKQNIQAIVSDFTLQETFTILLYNKKGHLIQDFLTLLMEDPLFTLTDIDIETLVNTLSFAQKKSFKPKISMTDWTLAYLSTNLRIPLVTFDRQLRNLCKNTA